MTPNSPRNGRAPTLGTLLLAALLVACDGSSPPPQGQPETTSSARTPPAPCTGAPADLDRVEVDVEGDTREAVVHTPPGADVPTPLPLVMAFHGYGGTASRLEDLTHLFDKADAEGFVVVLPMAAGNPSRWEVRDPDSADLAFVDELLTDLETRICIDPSRIFATGFSLGGEMANAVGCSRPDRFAAIAPVAGVYAPRWRDICAGEPVPVIGFHGVLDPVVPYEGGTAGGRPILGAEQWAAEWAELNGCAGGPESQAPIGDAQPLFWTGCAAPVEFYRVTEAGHSWPGGANDDPEMGGSSGAVSANDLIWDFFQRHPLTP